MGGDDMGRCDLPAVLLGWFVRLAMIAAIVALAIPLFILVGAAAGWFLENGPWMPR